MPKGEEPRNIILSTLNHSSDVAAIDKPLDEESPVLRCQNNMPQKYFITSVDVT
jgi:hypothetical protein